MIILMKIGSIVIFLMTLIGCSTRQELQEVPISDPGLQKQASGLLLYKGEAFTGKTFTYYEDSVKARSESYKDGKLHGSSLAFFQDGSMKQERGYTDGQKHGIHVGYYPSGQKRFEYVFELGKSVGTHYTWHVNGSLASEQNFQEGKPFGTQKMWYSSGKIKSNFVIREDGRKYGLIGTKRCKNIDTDKQSIKGVLGG